MNIKPISGSPAPADVASDLRALANLIEHDTDGYLAAVLHGIFKLPIWPAHAAGYEYDAEKGAIIRDRPAIMAEAIRRFKTIAVGPVTKVYTDRGDGYFEAVIPLRGLPLTLTDERAEVCERVVIHVETVTEQVPDPEYLAAAPTVAVEREVEHVEWKCTPILSHTEAVSA
ncbi:hypothetical protein GFY24_00950 [Nocardia sp. SYP-A9097]|uniref:hypothetical protein n=1 Tax=Nocardia sp. SYP-A9097 TaxID=2663237 RepID=UPI00129A0B05|nr:hypothetical protein [Nocardia sp. SYP-A9097]MRH86045.1 hypothetical protein [Nocardia sp. SYP-A9097]